MEQEKDDLTSGSLAKPNSSPENAEPEGTGQTSAAEPLEEGYALYNVMPKNISGPQVYTEPKIKIEEPQTPEKKKFKLVITPRIKTYTYIAIGVIILLTAGYFAYSWYMHKESGQENLLSNLNTKPHDPMTNPTVKPTTTPATQLTDSTWQKRYFGNETCQDQSVCGQDADPDHDGLTNVDEYKLGTDPNNPDSDGDGLADGDEVHVFGSNPLNARSANDSQYTDGDYAKGGYDFVTGQNDSPAQISGITDKMKQYGLHEPTIKTLQDLLVKRYNFTDWMTSPSQGNGTNTASSTPPISSTTTPGSGIDTSLGAQQDRDAQRSSVINEISVALIKYYGDNKAYPSTNDFQQMFAAVKVYMHVATNPVDPLNKTPYVYSYMPNSDGKDFTLSFYSEVAGQAIKKHAADAQKIMNQQQASSYDEQRKIDLESLQTALLLYSSKNTAGNQDYVFPTVDKFQTDLVPNYIPSVPKDPKTGQDYLYEVSATFDSFTLKAILDNPPAGTTGYLCNETECRNY